MKKLLTLLLCAAIAVSAAACAGPEASPDNTQTQQPTEAVKIPNPYQTFDSLKEAADTVGFSVELPQTLPDWVTDTAFRTIQTEMLEVTYTGGSDQIRIRKAEGTDDISGDYTVYPESKEVSVGQRTVTLKETDGTVRLAIWQDGGYTYAVAFRNGMDADSACAMIEAIK